MKNYFFLFLLFVLVSCSKEPNSALVGEWEWIMTSGGFAGETITPETVNQTRSLTIINESIQYFQDGELSHEENYNTSFHEDCSYCGDIFYEFTNNQFFSLEGDTLTLLDNCDDCYYYTYRRK